MNAFESTQKVVINGKEYEVEKVKGEDRWEVWEDKKYHGAILKINDHYELFSMKKPFNTLESAIKAVIEKPWIEKIENGYAIWKKPE